MLGPTLFCHGSPRSDEECVTVATPDERVAEFTAGVEEVCIVTAHTHMQYDRRVGETRLLNPGSVGLPTSRRPGTRTGRSRGRTPSCGGRRPTPR